MKICIVSSGLYDHNRRLQPWHYLLSTAHALAEQGHQVTLLSDGYPRLPRHDAVEGLPTNRLSSLGALGPDRSVMAALQAMAPDVVLWHSGLTSFAKPSVFRKAPGPGIGLFTCPVYQPAELACLGLRQLLRGWRLSAGHLAGLLVPRAALRQALRRGRITDLVVECETTRGRLIDRGAPAHRVHVVRPAIDRAWFETRLSPEEREQIRSESGFSSEEVVVGYMGPSAPLRGLGDLIAAIALARREDSRVRLLALVRPRKGAEGRDRPLLALEAESWAKAVTDTLSPAELARSLLSCDAIALPFRLVPSDVPLSVLEAMALGLPAITTSVACLPELVPENAGLRVRPGRPTELADAILALASDRALRKRLGAGARAQAEGWQARRGGEVWRRLLAQQAQRGQREDA